MKKKIRTNQEKGNDILPNIKQAINILLQPYDINFDDLLKDQQEISLEAKYLTIDQVEQQYSIGRYTLYRAIKAKKFNAVKLNQAKSGRVLVNVK